MDLSGRWVVLSLVGVLRAVDKDGCNQKRTDIQTRHNDADTVIFFWAVITLLQLYDVFASGFDLGQWGPGRLRLFPVQTGNEGGYPPFSGDKTRPLAGVSSSRPLRQCGVLEIDIRYRGRVPL